MPSRQWIFTGRRVDLKAHAFNVHTNNEGDVKKGGVLIGALQESFLAAVAFTISQKFARAYQTVAADIEPMFYLEAIVYVFADEIH